MTPRVIMAATKTSVSNIFMSSPFLKKISILIIETRVFRILKLLKTLLIYKKYIFGIELNYRNIINGYAS
jgi:hypothetical protein